MEGLIEANNTLLVIDESGAAEDEDGDSLHSNTSLDTVHQPATTTSPALYQQFVEDSSGCGGEAQPTYQDAAPENISSYSNGQYGQQLNPQDALNSQQFTAVQGDAHVNAPYQDQQWTGVNNMHILTRDASVSQQAANDPQPFRQEASINILPSLTMSELQAHGRNHYSRPPFASITSPMGSHYSRIPHSSTLGQSGSTITPQTNNPQAQRSNLDCRYPVLQPLVPYVSSFISPNELCNLLDLYFTEPSNSLFECASPYVLTQIFRKKSFLQIRKPRKTSPALLAAMLWVTAQTSDAQIFKTSGRARSLICDQLLKVCFELLDSPDLKKGPRKESKFMLSCSVLQLVLIASQRSPPTTIKADVPWINILVLNRKEKWRL